MGKQGECHEDDGDDDDSGDEDDYMSHFKNDVIMSQVGDVQEYQV